MFKLIAFFALLAVAFADIGLGYGAGYPGVYGSGSVDGRLGYARNINPNGPWSGAGYNHGYGAYPGYGSTQVSVETPSYNYNTQW